MADGTPEAGLRKMVDAALRYDFYGELLTEKQRAIFENYYFQDCSLGEIAQERGVTPQGVSDLLRRTGRALQVYEDKLRLVARHGERRAKLDKAAAYVAALPLNPAQRAPLLGLLEEIRGL
jgi:predicted DNA-binding protein YlxM (UPF0122 family)